MLDQWMECGFSYEQLKDMYTHNLWKSLHAIDELLLNLSNTHKTLAFYSLYTSRCTCTQFIYMYMY